MDEGYSPLSPLLIPPFPFPLGVERVRCLQVSDSGTRRGPVIDQQNSGCPSSDSSTFYVLQIETHPLLRATITLTYTPGVTPVGLL